MIHPLLRAEKGALLEDGEETRDAVRVVVRDTSMGRGRSSGSSSGSELPTTCIATSKQLDLQPRKTQHGQIATALASARPQYTELKIRISQGLNITAVDMHAMPPSNSTSLQHPPPTAKTPIHQSRRRARLLFHSRQPSNTDTIRPQTQARRPHNPRRNPHHRLRPRLLASSTARLENRPHSPLRRPPDPRAPALTAANRP